MANCPVCLKKLGLLKREELLQKGCDLVLIGKVDPTKPGVTVYAITQAAYKHMLEHRAKGKDWDPIPGALKLGKLRCHVPLTQHQAGELLREERKGKPCPL